MAKQREWIDGKLGVETMTNRTIATVKTWRGPVAVTVTHAALAVALLVLIGGLVAAWRIGRGAEASSARGVIPISPEIEEKFGIRFTQMAVIAEGGMIDLRYRIIDEGKAANFGHYTETAPMLIAEDSGKIVDTTLMGFHHHNLEVGRVYYILYRNTANAIEPGSKVTIAIDELSLEHVVSW